MFIVNVAFVPRTVDPVLAENHSIESGAIILPLGTNLHASVVVSQLVSRPFLHGAVIASPAFASPCKPTIALPLFQVGIVFFSFGGQICNKVCYKRRNKGGCFH